MDVSNMLACGFIRTGRRFHSKKNITRKGTKGFSWWEKMFSLHSCMALARI